MTKNKNKNNILNVTLLILILLFNINFATSLPQTNITCENINGTDYCIVNESYNQSIILFIIFGLLWLISIILTMIFSPLMAIGGFLSGIVILTLGVQTFNNPLIGVILLFITLIIMIIKIFRNKK